MNKHEENNKGEMTMKTQKLNELVWPCDEALDGYVRRSKGNRTNQVAADD